MEILQSITNFFLMGILFLLKTFGIFTIVFFIILIPVVIYVISLFIYYFIYYLFSIFGNFEDSKILDSTYGYINLSLIISFVVVFLGVLFISYILTSNLLLAFSVSTLLMFFPALIVLVLLFIR